MTKPTQIKAWAIDDRPREKLLLKGKNALSDAELLAILLGTGMQNKTAVDLAKEMLSASENDLSRFSKWQLKDFLNFKGIGEAKAVTILAALELGRRRKDTEMPKNEKITSSLMAYNYMKRYLLDLQHEEFHVLLLNRANHVIRSLQISIGGMAGTVADGKVIFKSALDHASQAIILVHNHPSGQLQPSEADKALTLRMVEFGKYIDLPVLDHIIFTDNGYFSFSDNGLIN
jgi:DNA repair protein RadC